MILPEFTPLPADDLQNHEYVGVPLWIPDAQVREAAYTWILERFGDSVDCHKNRFWRYCAARLHEGHRSAASGEVPAVGASG